jgi:pyoverdine/dityrosine biosynthesis protein Dit1
MAAVKKFTYINFSYIKDLIDFPLPDKLREITYVANCTNFRRSLLNKFGRHDIDVNQEIVNNPDTKLTYLGYRKFLESDLKYIFTLSMDRGSNAYKRDVRYLAKQMLLRGFVSPNLLSEVHLAVLPSLMTRKGFCWSCQTCIPQLFAALHS